MSNETVRWLKLSEPRSRWRPAPRVVAFALAVHAARHPSVATTIQAEAVEEARCER